MKTEEIKHLFERFEKTSSKLETMECWSARELQELLGYSKWENFTKVIDKAKLACTNAGEETSYHFPPISKVVQITPDGVRDIEDIALTRYACYLVAQNGDSRKAEIAFAQAYFVVQTRKAEIIEQRLLDYKRVQAREKLSQTEKQLSTVIYERSVDDKGFSVIRSKGDEALFNLNTQTLKKQFEIPDNRPLADFLPIISIKAKDLAAEMTGLNVQIKDLNGYDPIQQEHIDNNAAVRKMLLDRGIKPEELPVAEDVKKVQRKLKGDSKQVIKQFKRENSAVRC